MPAGNQTADVQPNPYLMGVHDERKRILSVVLGQQTRPPEGDGWDNAFLWFRLVIGDIDPTQTEPQ